MDKEATTRFITYRSPVLIFKIYGIIPVGIEAKVAPRLGNYFIKLMMNVHSIKIINKNTALWKTKHLNP